ncbi:MAG: nicotinate-nucleotide diphosphorylase (carboxylating), partial [Candidatus Bathyarchaeia archaeon]
KVSFTKKIEVEAKTTAEAVEATRARADIIMLDNMKPSEAAEALRALREEEHGKRALVEVSGGVAEENILDYARLDVDVISIGALTHSAKAIDFSLDIEPVRAGAA